MNCKFCDTENSEKSVFCKSCGARLDGNIFCYACGTPSPADSEYCTSCGRKLLGGVKKRTSGVEISLRPAAKRSGHVGAIASKVLNKIAVAASLACSLFALIFVFLICIKFTGENAVSRDIAFYFNDCYKDYNKVIELYDNLNENIANNVLKFSYFYPDSMLVSYIFGTVILAGTILGVAILVGFSVVYSILNLCGKSEKNGIHTAVAAFIVYAVGSSLMLSLSAMTGDETVSVKLSPATLAGISLCAVFAIISLGCNVASKGRELLNKKVIIDHCFALAGMVIMAIVIGLACAPMLGDDEYKMSYFNALAGIAVLCPRVKDHMEIENADALAVLCTVSTLMLVITAVCAAVAMIMSVRRLNGKKRILLPFTVAAFVGAVAVLVLTIVTDWNLDEAIRIFDIENFEETKFDYAVPIAITVMTVLALGLNVAHIILDKLIFAKKSEN